METRLIKNTELHYPITDTADRWYVNACAHEFADALKLASLEMMHLLIIESGWDETDTYMYMSVQCHAELDQACVPCEVPMILRMGHRRSHFPRDL